MKCFISFFPRHVNSNHGKVNHPRNIVAHHPAHRPGPGKDALLAEPLAGGSPGSNWTLASPLSRTEDVSRNRSVISLVVILLCFYVFHCINVMCLILIIIVLAIEIFHNFICCLDSNPSLIVKTHLLTKRTVNFFLPVSKFSDF